MPEVLKLRILYISRKPFVTGVWLVLLMVAGLDGFGQEPLNQFYEMDNVHSKELIKGVLRDDEGYLWVATDDGILKYDGLETVVYNGLATPFTKEFLQAKNGQVYVIHDTGIERTSIYGDSIFSQPMQLGSEEEPVRLSYPKSIFEDSDSTLWIGEIDAIVKIKGGNLTRYNLGMQYQSISYHHSFSFAEDAFGHIWVAPFKGTLLAYDEHRDQFDPISLSIELTEVSSIVAIKGDHLLIGGKEGIVELKIDSNKEILDSKFLSHSPNISDMEVLGNSFVYVATWDDGLHLWDYDQGDEAIVKLEEVNIIDIVNLNYSQHNRELWIAGGESVGVLKRTQVNALEQTGTSRIESLTFAEEGRLYFSSGESVFQYDEKPIQQVKRLLYTSETFYGRLLYDDGLLWIGDFFGKVYDYDFKSGKFNYLVSEPGAAITFITKDSKGNKWFAGNANSLYKVDAQNKLKTYTEVKSSVLVRVSKSGRLVSAQRNGHQMLSQYNPQDDTFSEISLTFDASVSSDFTVNDFAFDKNENIWVASSEGLLFVEKSTTGYSTVSKINVVGYEGEAIRSIAISDQLVWLGFPEGLVLYNEEESLLFNKDSGLPSSILKERGLKYGPDRKLYVYTAKGLATIDEKQVQFRKSKRPLFKSMTVNGQSVDWTQEEGLVIPFNARLSCDFLSLAFPNTKLQYQSRVVGYDEEWSEPSITNTSLSILGFSEGEYALEIRAKKGGNLWSEPLRFSFTVAKPWYREWWSLVLFLTAIGLLVVLVVQIHNRNLIRQKRRLQEIIEERTSEIQAHKNEIIDQQEKLIKQKEQLLLKNQDVHNSEQARDKAELNFLHLKEKQLEEQIDYKNKQITTHALNILQKNETLKELRDEINGILKKPEKSTIGELKKTLKLIDSSFKLDKDWEDFKLYFEQIYTGFYAKLKVNFPEITNLEMRHCALIRLNLPIAECASILGISHDSVKVTRSRLRKKLGLVQNQSLTEFIMSL